MIYSQKQYSFYNPMLVRISVGSCDVTVNYLEALDQSCVETSHVHKSYEVYYCLSGTQHVAIDGVQYTLFPGHFAIIPPGIHHSTCYEPDCEKRYLVFVFTPPTTSTAKIKSPSREGEFLIEALSYFKDHSCCVMKDKFGCLNLIERLKQEIQVPLPGHQQMISALYQEYIISILRNLNCISETAEDSSNRNMAIEITKYMHANYFKNFTIQDIAEVFYISPRHINRVFEEYFGESFKRTLNIYRLNYAKNYFIDTDYSVEKVASLVGFSSPKMLYQLFKEIEGMTVAEYRAMHGGTKKHDNLH